VAAVTLTLGALNTLSAADFERALAEVF